MCVFVVHLCACFCAYVVSKCMCMCESVHVRMYVCEYVCVCERENAHVCV